MKFIPLWITLLLGIIFGYCFLDRPICEFINTHAWAKHLEFMKPLPGWPPVMTFFAPILFIGSFFCKPGKLKEVLFLMSVSILVTFVLKNDLKWVFGRAWPLTWTHNNPSWISNHVYGFHWFDGTLFQGSETSGAFPSGHTAIAFATLLPIGLIYRSVLPFCIALASLEGIAMIAYDYHFLSDVLAGAMVGIACVLVIRTFLNTKATSQKPNNSEFSS